MGAGQGRPSSSNFTLESSRRIGAEEYEPKHTFSAPSTKTGAAVTLCE
jgi:hypothetical protein